jgi:hypothetical protein
VEESRFSCSKVWTGGLGVIQGDVLKILPKLFNDADIHNVTIQEAVKKYEMV